MNSDNLIETLRAVVEVAKKDGKITDDEYNLLTQMSIDVAEYSIMLDKAKLDGVIDDEEQEILEELKEKIIANAQIVAELDDVVTEEELKLLTKLSEIISRGG